jgi:protein-tyrosine phosphatase
MQIKYLENNYGGKQGFLNYCYHGAINFFGWKYTSRLPIKVNRVVFVCRGNICRSPVAEIVFKGLSNLPVCSIGLDTHTGKKANQKVFEVASELNIDLSSHRTTSIADFRKQDGDLFICMEPHQIEQLKSFLGDCETLLLGVMRGNFGAYIHDPYNSNRDYVKACIKNIQLSVGKLVEKMN